MTSSRGWVIAVVLLGAGVGSGGCDADNGQGTIRASLNVPACTFRDGTPQPLDTAKPPFNQQDHQWNFFVGSPFDSTTPRFPANQLNIRMQGSPSRLEFADAVTFWVLDSYEVGRCMRGRVRPEDGMPDWDPERCDRSPGSLGPSGEGRVLIGTENEFISSGFVLFASCPVALISATALGTCHGNTCPAMDVCPGRGSWITFSRFGSPPAMPAALSTGFKVNNEEIIQASAFHVELCDIGTVDAQRAGLRPPPPPRIIGTLDGTFQFALERQQR